MPFIYSAQPTRHTPTAVAMKQGRHSLESEFAVEEQLPPVYPGSEAWDAMVAEDEGRWDDDTEDSDVSFPFLAIGTPLTVIPPSFHPPTQLYSALFYSATSLADIGRLHDADPSAADVLQRSSLSPHPA